MRTMSGITRRQLLVSLPVAALSRRAVGAASPEGLRYEFIQAGTASPPIRVRTISHFGLAVSDPKRSVDFYQGLFGMPVQARVDTTTILRVGA